MSYGYGRSRRSSDESVFSSAFKLRMLIALAMVVFSVLSYLSTSSKNPMTGEKQRVAMSPDQEIQMGLQASAQMAAQHGGLYPDPRDQAAVDAVGARLLRGLASWLEQAGRSNPYKFEFHLLRDDRTINAFALPGGQVFITHALFSRLETEGQLAGVLGHEIGHVIERHGAQRMAQQKLTVSLSGAAGVAGGDINSARLAQAIGQLVNMQYGRSDELESDRWGVLLMAQSGYSPEAMLGVMRILDEASRGGPPEMLSTHPKPANRMQYIQEVIREVFPQGLPPNLQP